MAAQDKTYYVRMELKTTPSASLGREEVEVPIHGGELEFASKLFAHPLGDELEALYLVTFPDEEEAQVRASDPKAGSKRVRDKMTEIRSRPGRVTPRGGR
jgi:hypothetical protein